MNLCNAPTKSGTCKRIVKEGQTRCYMHRNITSTNTNTVSSSSHIGPRPTEKNQKLIVQHIKQVMNHAECCQEYENVKYVNHGSVGVVFSMTHRRNGAKVILKIQPVSDTIKDRQQGRTKKQDWLHEMKYLQKFSDIGLGVNLVTYCIVNHIPRLKGEFGLIIMDPITNTLDQYLSTRRTSQELDHVGQELYRMFKSMYQNQVSHGDLAFFNIGYVMTPTPHSAKHPSIQIRLIDFDRSAIDQSWIEVDVLRVIDALYSELTVFHTNADYLYNHWRSKWLSVCPNASALEKLSFDESQKRWRTQYNQMMMHYGHKDKCEK